MQFSQAFIFAADQIHSFVYSLNVGFHFLWIVPRYASQILLFFRLILSHVFFWIFMICLGNLLCVHHSLFEAHRLRYHHSLLARNNLSRHCVEEGRHLLQCERFFVKFFSHFAGIVNLLRNRSFKP